MFFPAPTLFQGIEATLSENNLLLVLQQVFEAGKGSFISFLSPPGMNAGGIQRTLARPEKLLAENDFPRQGNNGICSLRIVRVVVQAI